MPKERSNLFPNDNAAKGASKPGDILPKAQPWNFKANKKYALNSAYFLNCAQVILLQPQRQLLSAEQRSSLHHPWKRLP